ncbi:tripeptidyl peptidase A [Russula brevipes]|nr:tripeptidyl peptidase A [Russula brevipes]
MRALPQLPFLLALIFPFVTSTRPHDLQLRQSVTPPRGWIQMGRAPAAHIIQLHIALPSSASMKISDPSHVRYGEHLSKEEVEELVAPHESSVDAREACRLSPARDWITVHVPVAHAEKMLGTEFGVWMHEQDGDVLVRTTEYSLPVHLGQHVEFVQPTTAFHRARGLRTTFRFSAAPEDSSISAEARIAELYGLVNYVPKATKKNTIALTGYLGEFVSYSDVQRFYADQVPAAVKTSFDVVLIDGGKNEQIQAGAEANLDVQFALGISFPTPGTFYSTGGYPPFNPDKYTVWNTNEPYMAWLEFILAQKKIPQTISTSYGDDEQTGARGTSLLFSTGDGGVGDGDPDPATHTCLTNDGKKRTKFVPSFPASCPFVTAVGGTIYIPEVAADFSGGGFSDIFPRPKWQEAAVAKFLKTLSKGTYAGFFNPDGRAFPDVAAQANNFRIFFQGNATHISGTSAATPSFAGLIALLNDARIAVGKRPLGFLNRFNDITAGNAPGCGTPGFNATAGWDPVTGFGTPNFEKLREHVLKI